MLQHSKPGNGGWLKSNSIDIINTEVKCYFKEDSEGTKRLRIKIVVSKSFGERKKYKLRYEKTRNQLKQPNKSQVKERLTKKIHNNKIKRTKSSKKEHLRIREYR